MFDCNLFPVPLIQGLRQRTLISQFNSNRDHLRTTFFVKLKLIAHTLKVPLIGVDAVG